MTRHHATILAEGRGTRRDVGPEKCGREKWIAPRTVAPARGPPQWDLPDGATGDGELHAQPAPDVEFDQRIAW